MTRKEEIDKNGYILIKNIFSEEEINKFREFVEKEKNHKGDLLSSGSLKNILIDDRIVSIFKECLGSDTILYFGDSSSSYNVGGSGFHKDSRDRENVNSEEYKDKNYSLLRLGIYLQDHSKHSKGLCLRAKSHFYPTVGKGKIINVKSEIGDVIIWKYTTTHSANADVISLFPNFSFHPTITRMIPNFLKQKSIDPRMVLFMSFGLEDHYSSAYIEYLKTRQYAVDRWEASKYSQESIAELESKNVKLYKEFDIKNIDIEKVSEAYKQL